METETTTAMTVTESSAERSSIAYYFEKLRSIVTVEIVFFLYFFGIVSYFSTLSQYVFARISKDRGFMKDDDQASCVADNHTQEYNDLAAEVQAASSRFMTIQTAVCLLPGLVMTLFLGHYSDYAGRKVVLIPAVASASLRGFLTMLVVYYRANLYYLLVLGVLDAFTGGAVAVVMAVFAYITDISSSERRTLRMLVVEISLALGIAIAGSATGVAIKDLDYLVTFLLPTVSHALNTVYVAFYLKETVQRIKGVRFFTLNHIKGSFHLFFPCNGGTVPKKLLLGALYLSLYVMVELSTHDITTFYLLGPPICFGSVNIGTYSTLSTVIKFLGGVIGAKFLIGRLGPTALLIICCVSGAVSQIIFGLSASTDPHVVYLVPVIGALASLALPIVRSFASKCVAQQQLGSLFAALSFCQQFSQFLGTTIFNSIFSKTVAIYAGLVFFVCAAWFFLTSIVAVCLHRVVKREKFPSEEFHNDVTRINAPSDE